VSTMETDLPYLSAETDRHGNPRIYVRRNGKRIRIREREGTPAFAKAYTEAVEKLGGPPGKERQSHATSARQGHAGLAGERVFQVEG
jgi:hypothetical protein